MREQTLCPLAGKKGCAADREKTIRSGEHTRLLKELTASARKQSKEEATLAILKEAIKAAGE